MWNIITTALSCKAFAFPSEDLRAQVNDIFAIEDESFSMQADAVDADDGFGLEADEGSSIEADEGSSIEADESSGIEADEGFSIEADEGSGVEADGVQVQMQTKDLL